MPKLWRGYEGAYLNMDISIFDGRSFLIVAIIALTWAWYWLGNE